MEKISKEEANKIGKQYFNKWQKECDELRGKLRIESKLLPGLDSNNHFFKGIDEKYKKMLKELNDRIDWNR